MDRSTGREVARDVAFPGLAKAARPGAPGIGDRIALSPYDLEAHLNTALKGAISILEAVSEPG